MKFGLLMNYSDIKKVCEVGGFNIRKYLKHPLTQLG